MGRRATIGLLYLPDTNWIGGTYYIQNLVQALKVCPDAELPIVKVYCSTHEVFREFQQITVYPYLKERLIQEYPVLYKWWRRINRFVFQRELPAPHLFARKTESDVFVYPTNASCLIDPSKALGWIPDFQDKHLPYFFSEKELQERERAHKAYIEHHIPVVLSSESARQDYFSYYPESAYIQTYVLPFAVTHPDFSAEDIASIRTKYGINGEYLFCANQFWKHKNHLFLFKSYLKAKEKGLKLQLICSGKLYDNHNPEYIEEIKTFITSNNLESDIKILGFIERTEQLCLMKNAYAIVQPSLFEGWSTVVEDAKCLNKFIFLSDIPVHKEQNPANVAFFNPRKEDELAQELMTIQPTSVPYDYSRDVRRFGETLIDIIEERQNAKVIYNYHK